MFVLRVPLKKKKICPSLIASFLIPRKAAVALTVQAGAEKTVGKMYTY